MGGGGQRREGGGRAGVGGGGKALACSLLLSESRAAGLLSPAPHCLGQSPPALNMEKTFTCLLLLLPMVRTSEVQLALENKRLHFKTWKIKIKVANKNSKILRYGKLQHRCSWCRLSTLPSAANWCRILSQMQKTTTVGQ